MTKPNATLSSAFKRRLRILINNYCQQTSLHGFHYIVDSHNPIKTTLWCLVCFVCMAFCFYLIYIQLVRFTTNVTNTSITSTGYPVWENPFPAVTVCSNYLVFKNRTGKITDILKTESFDHIQIEKFYNHLSNLVMCSHCELGNFSQSDLDVYGKMFSVLESAEYDVNRLMKEIAAPCDIILSKCYWKSKEMPCNDVFQLVKTTNGYCCAFNYYGSKDVQQMDVDEDEIRFFSGGSGIPFGLKVHLSLDENQYFGNVEANPGFEVVVRDGYDYPDMKMYSNSLLVGDILTIGLYPSVLRSHPDVKNVRTTLRECWFKNEGNLDSTYIYSFQTCLNECKAKAIYEFCKCVPFIFPLTKPKRLCTLADTPCLIENELKFNSLVLTTSLSDATLKKIDKRVGNAFRCHCLPTCDEVRYENFVEKSHSDDYERLNHSVLNVFYNSIACVKRTRNVIVTWDMLLASIGGIFGLCLGGSVLSLIELVYHIIGAFLEAEQEAKIAASATLPKSNATAIVSLYNNGRLYNGNITMHSRLFGDNINGKNIQGGKLYDNFISDRTVQLKKKKNIDGFSTFDYRN